MLFIVWPLWDDWSLHGLTFEQMAAPFKMNGFYNAGIPFLHQVFIVIPYGTLLLRILSLLLITAIPILYAKIFFKLNLPTPLQQLLVIVTACIPVFANAFPQIVFPYLICYSIYLSSFLGIIKYFDDKQPKWSIYLLVLPLLISYVTNSLLFHVVLATPLLLIYLSYKLEKPKVSKMKHVTVVVILSVIVFFSYKSLFMQPSGLYKNYNKITLNGLLLEGPKITALTLLFIVKGYIDMLVPVLKNTAHLIILAAISTVIYQLLKRIDLGNLILTRKYIYGLAGIGVFLFAIGAYPYGVVGKTALSYLDWNQRHLMLAPVGIAFILVAFIFLLPNTNLKVGGLAILLSSFLLIRVYVILQFYHSARLQQNFVQAYKQLPILNDESYLFVIDNQPQTHTMWRFYEFGGLLRENQLKNNKLFLYASGKYVNELGELNINKLEPEIFTKTNYGVQEFNLNNYQTKHISITYQPVLSIPEFVKSLVWRSEEFHQVKISFVN